ncbi:MULTISPECIES: hypothetical protein [Sphingobacterium]|uniref:Uncharacterized protein n=1 Tax=Sphingobacterium ginsenosidimutans TaxID=687845 RepID=A0ABP7ZT09_9SPHI|nr:hypothetical protein [Sphingobacterium sp. E70]ULT24228.1 hypothetical protein KUH03_35220 [Sphingobacterium sp. E70]
MYLYLIFLIGFALFIVLFSLIFRQYTAGFKPKNNQISYEASADLVGEKIRKISSRPFLFGLEDNLVSDEDFYFDDINFYAIDNKQQRKVVFPLTDIIELSKTSITITNHRVWQVIINGADNQKIVFKFTHNYTLWNKDFVKFYKKIAQINPAAIKSKWSLWTM